jgi:DNA-directed RNA polymerase subunit beta'
MYKDFVLRRLIRRGFPPTRAAELYDERKPEAKEMLLQEMQERPVIVDRAPTWHKFNLLAFMPHIVKDNTVRISPLVTNGFNMDFDGDQANFHVPVSEEAVSQAMRRMMPSRNLFSLTDLKSIRHSPTMEMTMGLYWLTQAAKRGKQVRTFKNHAEAKRAYKAGEIGVNDPITILDDG